MVENVGATPKDAILEVIAEDEVGAVVEAILVITNIKEKRIVGLGIAPINNERNRIGLIKKTYRRTT